MIKKAAVIGAGTMGAGIASHLANAGVPVVLLDIVPPDLGKGEVDDPVARSRFARGALKHLRKSKPAAFMSTTSAQLIETGNTEDHLELLRDCDWIIEAVTEDLEIKRSLYERIAKVRREDAIVSSNTSGLSLELLTKGFDAGFQRHFLVTHFFNPPRYMYLLEVVPGTQTSTDVTRTIESFCDVHLGKGVVRCKDTPNFIANRIGVFSMGTSCWLLEGEGLSIEEIDAITGSPMGRPKTATFRLHDLVGNDVAVMVMKNTHRLLPDDESRSMFEPPAFLERLVKEGRLGRKSGAGFYKKSGKDILVLDLSTFEYRQQKPVCFDSLELAKKQKGAAARLRTLVEGDDDAARFAWHLLSETLLYTARRIPEVSEEIVSIDRAVRWGFNWEIGPFECWDAVGVSGSVRRMEKEGKDIPAVVETLLSSGNESFYATLEEQGVQRRAFFDFTKGAYSAEPDRDNILLLDDVKLQRAPVRSIENASLHDLGDGVLGVEFHSKMNSLSTDMLDLIVEAVDLAEHGDYLGIVIGNQAPNFSVGANLVQLAEMATAQDWKGIDSTIRRFHATVLRVRYAAKPIIVATQGMVLGGGCEISLSGCRVQSAAETYMGLVELGVGLIPAGGGTREMACRAAEAVPQGIDADFFPYLRAYFENIALAKTSGSAEEAHGLGYLRMVDTVSMNRDRVLSDAKRRVIHLASAGYRPPPPRTRVRVAGRSGIAEFNVLLHQFQEGGFASAYDVHLGKKLAYVICGGDIDSENPVTEDYLLDLEREVFLGLCGEEKTHQRIAHTLKTGKPLRN